MSAVRAPRAVKHIKFSVPKELALRLLSQLKERRETRAAIPQPAPATAPTPERKGLKRRSYSITPLIAAPEHRAVHTSLFLPARARQLWREAALELSIRVQLTEAPLRPPWPLLLARDEADRQHRRKTWCETVERYALDPEAEVRVTFAGHSALAAYLQAPPQQAIA